MDGVQLSIPFLEKAVSENPKDADAMFKLAMAYLDGDAFQKAIAVLEKCLEIDPERHDARFMLGYIYSKGSGFSYALNEFQKIVDQDGDFCFDLIDRSLVRDPSPVIKAWEGYAASEKDSPAKLFSAGFAFLALGDADRALGFFKSCMSVNPGYGAVNFFAALVAYGKDDLNSAWNFFQQDASVRPQSPNSLYYLGMICFRRGNYKQAVSFFQKAVSLKKGYAKAIRGMGLSYAALSMYPQAEKCLEQLVMQKALLPGVYMDLGGVFAAQGRMEEASDAYGKALSVDPLLFEANIRLGEMFLSSNPSSAVDYFSKAVSAAPGNEAALCGLGSALMALGRFQEAATEINKALSKNPDSLAATRLFGECMLGLGRISSALDLFRSAIEQAPGDGELRRLAGMAYLRMGDFSSAAEQLRKAVELNPDDADAHYGLGIALSSSGMDGNAMGEYKLAVASGGDDVLSAYAEGAGCLSGNDLAGAVLEFQKASGGLLSSSLSPSVGGALQMLASAGLSRARRLEEISSSSGPSLDRRLLEIVMRSVDGRDGCSFAHSLRISKMARVIAEHIGSMNRDLLSEKEIEAIEVAGLLHDIGKVIIPVHILAKQSPLTEEEYALIRKHPEEGERILAGFDLKWDVLPMVRHHHEKFNGKGYPDKLSENAIPFGAMIICIADIFEALISNRPYRQAFSFEKAVTLINKRQGNDFAPGLVKAFIDVVPEISRIVAEIR